MSDTDIVNRLFTLSSGLMPIAEATAMRDAADAIERLRAERDEARREVCDLKSWNFDRAIKPEDYALLRKWGCFPPAT